MKRKGFTLTELVVTLTVSGIILSSVLAIIVSITSYTHIRNEKIEVNEELVLVETRLSDWFSAQDTSATPAPVASAEQLSIGEKRATFDSVQNTLVLDEAVYETRYVTGITFAQSEGHENLVKCIVSYTSEETTGTYVFMLLKRSVNMGT